MKLYRVKDFAAMNAENNQWPHTECRIRNLLYQFKKHGIKGASQRAGRLILICIPGFYEAVAKLPQQGLKYKKQDMPKQKGSLLTKKVSFMDDRIHTISALKEAGEIFYNTLERGASIGDIRIPVIDYLWRCIFLIGGLANRAHADKEQK